MFTTQEDRRLSAFLSAARDASKSILLQKLELGALDLKGVANDDKDILSVLG